MKRPLLFLLSLLLCASASAVNVADSLYQQLGKAKEDTNKVILLHQLCWEYRTSNPGKAYVFGHQAIELAQKLQYDRGLANAYNRLGVVHYRQGNYVEATTSLLNALVYWEKLGDKRGMAKSYSNLGNVFSDQLNYDKALEYYLQAVEMANETRDDRMLSTYYINIGTIYTEQRNYGHARDFFNEALKIARHYGDKAQEAQLLNNMGVTLQRSKKPQEGLSYFREALALNDALADKREMATCYMNMATAYVDLKRQKEAKEALVMAEELARAMDYKDGLREVYRIYSNLYELTGDYPAALRYHRHYADLSDTLFSEENSIHVSELDARYQAERRDRELQSKQALLDKQNAEERERNIYLYSALGAALVLLIAVFIVLRANRQKQRVNEQLEVQKQEIEQKSTELAVKNKDITDSIVYSRRIQQAMMPAAETVKRLLPGSFIFFRPRDIVSGDFYWVEQWGSRVLAAAVDCTGHGVPGALMSMVGGNLLSQSVNVHGISKPGPILNMLNKGLSATLGQRREEDAVNDGMDLALVAIDRKEMKAEFAGAHNPLLLVRGGQLIEYKGDNRPIGHYLGEEQKPFTNHEFDLQPGDMIYLLTDGYADQFGGPKGKKFKYAALKEVLCRIAALPAEEQARQLEKILDDWKGPLEQVDDILLVGIRI